MVIDVIRHPKSKPEDDTVDDAQRQVTNRGAKQFKGVLKQYDKAGEMNPDVIFCGPETRNMQAAELARDFFGLDQKDVVQSVNLGPGGDPKALLGEVKQWAKENDPDDSAQVALIGSNPALASFFQLVHGLGTKAGQSGSVKLKKGSVAKLKVYGLQGSNPSSELRSYVPPGLARRGK